jgi:hypothetical protein
MWVEKIPFELEAKAEMFVHARHSRSELLHIYLTGE